MPTRIDAGASFNQMCSGVGTKGDRVGKVEAADVAAAGNKLPDDPVVWKGAVGRPRPRPRPLVAFGGIDVSGAICADCGTSGGDGMDNPLAGEAAADMGRCLSWPCGASGVIVAATL